MGGWMTYGRMRNRNGLTWRPEDGLDPYIRSEEQRRAVDVPDHVSMLLHGDLNRMEQDYLSPVYPEAPFATRPEGSDPSAECAAATGVGIETVRAVLAYVFRESR